VWGRATASTAEAPPRPSTSNSTRRATSSSPSVPKSFLGFYTYSQWNHDYKRITLGTFAAVKCSADDDEPFFIGRVTSVAKDTVGLVWYQHSGPNATLMPPTKPYVPEYRIPEGKTSAILYNDHVASDLLLCANWRLCKSKKLPSYVLHHLSERDDVAWIL
jgi:hypothetical protein